MGFIWYISYFLSPLPLSSPRTPSKSSSPLLWAIHTDNMFKVLLERSGCQPFVSRNQLLFRQMCQFTPAWVTHNPHMDPFRSRRPPPSMKWIYYDLSRPTVSQWTVPSQKQCLLIWAVVLVAFLIEDSEDHGEDILVGRCPFSTKGAALMKGQLALWIVDWGYMVSLLL